MAHPIRRRSGSEKVDAFPGTVYSELRQWKEIPSMSEILKFFMKATIVFLLRVDEEKYYKTYYKIKFFNDKHRLTAANLKRTILDKNSWEFSGCDWMRTFNKLRCDFVEGRKYVDQRQHYRNKHIYAVQRHFTFGKRKVPRNVYHVFQTSQKKMVLYLHNSTDTFPREGLQPLSPKELPMGAAGQQFHLLRPSRSHLHLIDLSKNRISSGLHDVGSVSGNRTSASRAKRVRNPRRFRGYGSCHPLHGPFFARERGRRDARGTRARRSTVFSCENRRFGRFRGAIPSVRKANRSVPRSWHVRNISSSDGCDPPRSRLARYFREPVELGIRVADAGVRAERGPVHSGRISASRDR